MILELSLVFKLTDGIPTLEDFINDLVNAYVLDLKNCDTESQCWMKQIFPRLQRQSRRQNNGIFCIHIV
jgi:hypothetical protein